MRLLRWSLVGLLLLALLMPLLALQRGPSLPAPSAGGEVQLAQQALQVRRLWRELRPGAPGVLRRTQIGGRPFVESLTRPRRLDARREALTHHGARHRGVDGAQAERHQGRTGQHGAKRQHLRPHACQPWNFWSKLSP